MRLRAERMETSTTAEASSQNRGGSATYTNHTLRERVGMCLSSPDNNAAAPRYAGAPSKPRVGVQKALHLLVVSCASERR